MSLRDWFRPPRHLIALFLAITIVPSALLVVSGWRLIAQERALEEQQVRARREQLADLVVGSLANAIAATERALRDPAAVPGLSASTEVVAMVFTADGIEAFPPGRLPYYPRTAAGREADPEIFAEVESLEHTGKDPGGAIAAYRRYAQSGDRTVQAAALIRLGRTLARHGEPDAALQAFDRAAAMTGAGLAGVPADLLARFARCTLLERLARTAELRADAARLQADLLAGRWRIDRATFELHAADAARWLGGQPVRVDPERQALAEAAREMWQQWQAGRPTRRDSRVSGDGRLTLLWTGDTSRAGALVAGLDYLEQQWISGLAPLLDGQHQRLTLHDRDYRATSNETRRGAGETGLPWTIVLAPAAGADAGGVASGARRLWLAGFATLALLVGIGSYVVARAVSRELAVARLQTDFVAAVSHEFRTPLTSLRQLTEMLGDRPETPIERRREYYAALSRQTDRLRRLVESLLDFGRMEAGRAPYRFAPIEAGAFVEDVVHTFEVDGAARRVSIAVDVASSACVDIDRDALTNAVWNLLDNAVKYSTGGLSVCVHVRAEDHAVAIAVRDRGIGIPPEEQRAIFGKFVRGERAKRENIQGTGIGLAIVEHIVRAHGGEVTVESGVGEGSTFTIRLPRARSSSAASVAASVL